MRTADLEVNIATTEIKTPTLYDLALEIKSFEGDYEGAVSVRNNNPGNLRYSPYQVGVRDGFSYFDTYEGGFNALLYQLDLAASDRSSLYNSSMTLTEFFNVYAPAGDDNNPNQYASTVIERLGVSHETTIGELYTQ